MRAMALPAFGKMVGQSLKARFVVRTRLFFSYLRLTTWNRSGGARVVGQIANFVHAEQAAGGVVVEPTCQAAGRLLAAEVEQELGGGGEEHVGPGEHGGVGDVLGNHRFSQTLRRHQGHVARVGEEVEPQGS
jgi:hypothetical protein